MEAIELVLDFNRSERSRSSAVRICKEASHLRYFCELSKDLGTWLLKPSFTLVAGPYYSQTWWPES